jgi:hypothetical protein
MRRVFFLVVLFLTLSLTGLLLAGAPALAQGYGPDLATVANAIDCGHYDASSIKDYAFDENASTYWLSDLAGASVPGASCIGQDFGATEYEIRRVGVRQVGSSNWISSAIVQAGNCSTWNSVDTVTLTLDTSMHYYDIAASAAFECWRILANAAPSARWGITEIDMMELVEWPSDTPGPSSTPTITLTPSTTPSPTPNINIEITSTQGAAMRIERRADFGQLAIFGAISGVFGLGVMWFGAWYWRRSNNARSD